MTIALHIEELVLHGFAPGDRRAIAHAVERELSRLLAEGGLPPALAAGAVIGNIDGGTFTVRTGARAGGIGAQVAGAVHDGMNVAQSPERDGR